MAETSKATVAGVCDMIAGICGLVGSIPLVVMALVGNSILGTVPEPELHILAPMTLVLFLPPALLLLTSGALAIAGGIAAFKRERWGLALAGSIAAVFGFLPVGIAAAVFTILAEPEFRAAAEGAG